MIEGQANLSQAIDRTIAFESPEGKAYRLNDELATLLVRPRGWHLVERHFEVDGAPISAIAVRLRPVPPAQPRARSPRPAAGPYFYLPKLESHREARSLEPRLRAAPRTRSGSRAGRSARPS